MCGFLGVVGRERESVEAAARRGLAALSHRGPDDHGFVTLRLGGDWLSLAHARLAVVDLSAEGRQPMVRAPLGLSARGLSMDGDDGAALVFNGEVYNHADLRRLLDSRGTHGWRGSSDAEVLLAGLAAEGEAFLPRLRGMFAFAFAEPGRGRVTLVRDRLGIKPLYFAETPDGTVFASEVRAVLATGLVPRHLDAGALRRWLAYGAVPEPDTLVEGVKSLPPAHVLCVANGRPSPPRRWWSLPVDVEASMTHAEGVYALRDELERTTAMHLAADVPVGLLLSGGLDSTALAGLAARRHPGLVACTVTDADDTGDDVHAALVARRNGLAHVVVRMGADELADAARRSMRAADLPTVDGTNTFVASEAIRKAGCTVALSGLGADELMLGYRFLSRLDLLPSSMRHLSPSLSMLGGKASPENHRAQRVASLARAMGDADAMLGQQRRLFFDPQLDALLKPSLRGPMRSFALDSEETGADLLQRAAAFELRGYASHMLLRDADQMSMAHGLELRVPMLDHRLVELVHRMPSDWKRPRSGENKPLLVDAVRDLIPETVVRRPKRGFGLDVGGWLRGPMRSEAEALLLREGIGFVPAFVRTLWGRFLAGDDHLTPRLWGLVRLSRWLEDNRVR
ncbi:MAG: hypothetical protein RL199_1091 [Pseudomonadota bacterium]|jgi:asparagine synthase (glutamine-hydrolysing)